MKKNIVVSVLLTIALLTACGNQAVPQDPISTAVETEELNELNGDEDDEAGRNEEAREAVSLEDERQNDRRQNEDRQEYKKYAEIMLDDGIFFDTNAQDYRQLSDYHPVIFSSALLNGRYRFAAQDMDGDGCDEVVLEYEGLDYYLVLRYEEGTDEEGMVYGYPFTHGEIIPLQDPEYEYAGAPEWFTLSKEHLISVFRPEELAAYSAGLAMEAAQNQEEIPADSLDWNVWKHILAGDFTRIADVKARQKLLREYQLNIRENGECTWRYVLLDFNDDGFRDLFIRFDTEFYFESALLCYQDGGAVCAFFDTNDHHDFYTPLIDGRLLYISDYYDRTDEIIETVNSDLSITPQEDYFSLRVRDYNDFKDGYGYGLLDVVDGEGIYYFVTESGEQGGEKRHITYEERLTIEQMIDQLIVPEYLWQSFAEVDVDNREYEDMRRRILEETGDTIYDMFYIDYEQDGRYSAFVFVGDEYEGNIEHNFWGDLWYVDQDSCRLIKERLISARHMPVLLQQEQEWHLLYTTVEKYLDNAGHTYIWTVRDGSPEAVLDYPGYTTIENGQPILTETYIHPAGGRRWNHYPLYWEPERRCYTDGTTDFGLADQ